MIVTEIKWIWIVGTNWDHFGCVFLYFYAENVQLQVTLFVFVLTEFLQVFMQKNSSWKWHCLCCFNWFFFTDFYAENSWLKFTLFVFVTNEFL